MKPDLCQNFPSTRARFQWRILRRKHAVAWPQSISLSADQVWSARLAAGARLRCLRGICWVTQKGERQDIILRSGEEMVLDKSTFIVVSALPQKGEKPEAEIRIAS